MLAVKQAVKQDVKLNDKMKITNGADSYKPK
jgi:hypothetical protein